MEDTGFIDILIEAGLIGSSSLKGVISGKHYERSLNCHKTVLESLKRLLLQRCQDKNESSLMELPQPTKEILKTMIKCPFKHILAVLLENEHLKPHGAAERETLKLFECSLCKAKFASNSSLKSHLSA